LVVKSHNGLAAISGMKYSSQHCCDKTVDGKMALGYITNAVFRIVKDHGE